MGLSREDIDNALAGNPHEADIRLSLSNYFEELNEPVAVAISLAPTHDDAYVSEVDNAFVAKEVLKNDRAKRGNFPEQVDKLVNLLRKNGIDAVSFFDPEAKNPAKFVVNENGIQCPFMEPEDALKATVLIETIARNENYNLVGHANPQSAANMLYAADKKLERKTNETHAAEDNYIDIKESNPQKDKFSELEQKYGGDYKSFIDKKNKRGLCSFFPCGFCQT